MIHIQPFTFNPFQENTYLLSDEDKNAIIIDPGMYHSTEVELMQKYIVDNGLNPVKVLLTHAHLDHVFGLKAFLALYDVPFFIHEKDIPVYEAAESVAHNYGLELVLPEKKYELISENETVSFGGEELEIRFVPGHSPGSIAFYSKVNGWVISGDLLFQNSVGRTDLPGSEPAALYHSVQTQLFTLPDNTKVYCGHGPSTTIGMEKMNNPYFQMR